MAIKSTLFQKEMHLQMGLFSIVLFMHLKVGTGFQPSSIAAMTPIFDKFASHENHSCVLGKWSKLYVCKFIQEQSGVFYSMV